MAVSSSCAAIFRQSLFCGPIPIAAGNNNVIKRAFGHVMDVITVTVVTNAAIGTTWLKDDLFGWFSKGDDEKHLA